ncbi:ABC transporter ATP-binding protein [Halapricum desulfuricans]|uniref:ABC-type multidrug transport system, ATPase component n=1 Tax=Halapricum desulfuricans TaxID=2841257 RepID=A0A897N791_9EURY|nr:ABC-type multidrug transport system, ATPase component [Halapricum desulfuricans]
MGDATSTGQEPGDRSRKEATLAGPTENGARDGLGEMATTAVGEHALVVNGVSKRFGDGESAVIAVDDVSFTVQQGAVVGLLGPNGAGKTTLIKSILGMVLPDEGSVEIFGTDASDGRRGAYIDVDAMLEGARNDYWRLTVRENLRYFATISGVDPDSVTARHDRLLNRLGLGDHADTAVRNLSRGMKQKVSLASVLAGGAKLIFLDEPTLGLDVESSRTLRTELTRLAREEGLTIFISSHNMTVIEDVCDRVIVMSAGQIVADGTVEELLGSADRNAIRITSADIDDHVVNRLESAFTLLSVETVDGSRRVELEAVGEELYTLMDTLRDAGVTVEQLHTVEPDLEDVFVSLTGDTQGLRGPSEGERSL